MTDGYFPIRQHSLEPELHFPLTDFPSLPDGAAVMFEMPPIFSWREALVLSSSPLVVGYRWQDGDTATIGTFPGAFRVVYENGRDEVLPPDSVVPVRVW